MFWNKLKSLEVLLATKEGHERGWFTYTELDTLIQNVDFQKLFQIVASFFTILLATYTAGLLTIIGSMFIVSHIPGNCLQNRFENNKTNLAVVINDTRINENITNAINLEIDEISNTKTETYKNSLDAINVLRTSIILASIKHDNSNISLKHDENENVQEISWEWWDCPTMQWLSETSKLMDNFNFLPKYNYNANYYQVYNLNDKKIDLQDQIHHATKIRIQDQMEISWHKEWTDTIKSNLFNYNPFYYFQDVAS